MRNTEDREAHIERRERSRGNARYTYMERDIPNESWRRERSKVGIRKNREGSKERIDIYTEKKTGENQRVKQRVMVRGVTSERVRYTCRAKIFTLNCK